ncbi:uncharacterized protein [Halyomorpha halys]|uniref:uncharacterized protein n=1 Tax=Halyomorpha halys TaxID=286706 RepID=UPI0006D50D5C|nr:uncharacterized protein LOC106689121 [Halyomorpha halys]
MLNICDDNVETVKNYNDCFPEMFNYENNDEIDCNTYESSQKSEFNNTQNKQKIMYPTEYMNPEDCANAISNEQSLISLKWKGKKYFPHFKTKVVSYALKHSIKKAALDFKVNKGTISGWIHESQQSIRGPIVNEIDVNYCGPDEEFIKWLRSFERTNVLHRQDVVDKVQHIIHSFEKQEPSKKSLWFFLYAKRLTNESSLDKIQIKYPLAFKKEVVSYTNYTSKKMASKIFNIDRKRICEWVSDSSNGIVKERDVSKYVTDPKVDKMIWDWYCLQQKKPSSKEIRLKAAVMYEEAGFSNMRCSPGWYYRWRLRHQLPTVRGSQASRDAKLLAWILIQLDENKSIFHSDLLKQAAQLTGATFKASSSWVFRFIKKYLSHFKPGITNIPLPESLIKEADNFKKLVMATMNSNHLQLHHIIAFDEIPLNFNSSGKQSSLIGKSDWENCQASVIVSCLANGRLLPTTVILKAPTESKIACNPDVQPILIQANGINDVSTIEKWLEVVLRHLTAPAMIIGDIYDPHVHIKNTYANEFDKKNISYMIIPGGCTSQLQPLFFGILQKFKDEIENQWVRWCHEMSSFSGNSKLKHPKSDDIVDWVQNAHLIIANSCKDQIKESFIKAGIIV